jgi:transcriptional antiterminator RfaH
MEAWYTVHTKPNSELQVDRVLIARGFHTYLPLLPARRGERGEPLFPTYLFVRCDLEAVGLARLEWIPGLRRILAFGGKPAVVPDDAVVLLQSKMAEIEADGGIWPQQFKVGDEVVIDEGPLRGMRGIFQGPTKPSERVQILIRFLGQANRADVPVEALRRAPEEEQPQRSRPRGTRGQGRRIRYHDRLEDK